jgi:hypothetical protein
MADEDTNVTIRDQHGVEVGHVERVEDRDGTIFIQGTITNKAAFDNAITLYTMDPSTVEVTNEETN